MAMINDLQLLCRTNDTATLNILIEQCKNQAITYCNLEEYDEKLDSIIENMVVERWNQRGSEGVNSSSYSGVSESYKDDYSPMIYKGLRKFKRLNVY